MPKRYRARVTNPEPGEPVDDTGALPLPPPKRKSKFWSYAKWVGAIGLGSIVGAVTMRTYDKYFPPTRRNKDEGGETPMLNPGFPALAGASPVSLNIMPPMFPTAPPAQAVQMNASDMTVAELGILLKRKKAAQKAARSRVVEEEFWDD